MVKKNGSIISLLMLGVKNKNDTYTRNQKEMHNEAREWKTCHSQKHIEGKKEQKEAADHLPDQLV